MAWVELFFATVKQKLVTRPTTTPDSFQEEQDRLCRCFHIMYHLARCTEKIGGVNPQFSWRDSPGNPFQTLCLQLFLHYILENYTREPPHYTRRGDNGATSANY